MVVTDGINPQQIADDQSLAALSDGKAFVFVTVELNAQVAANSPHYFASETPEDPSVHRPTERDLRNVDQWIKKLDALVVFYDRVYQQSNAPVQDFDINLVSSAKASQGLLWTKTAGPDSGELLYYGSADAVYSNLKLGGRYRFDLDLFGQKHVGSQALMPLAGADILF